MSKKKLPKAIKRTPGESAQAAAGPVISEPVISKPVISKPVTRKPVVNEPVVNEPVVNETVTRKPGTGGSASADHAARANPPPPHRARPAAPSPEVTPDPVRRAIPEKLPPVAQPLVPHAPVEAGLSQRRRTLAYAIVDRYATFSVGGGIIPLPIASVASVMAINVRMIQMLSNIYGIPFERERTRAMVAGLAAGAMPTGLAAATGSLSYLLPGGFLFALAVGSVTAGTFTRRIGRLFVSHFESGAAADLSGPQGREPDLLSAS